jgi:N-acetylmuramoyl-L-alanine amidase
MRRGRGLCFFGRVRFCRQILVAVPPLMFPPRHPLRPFWPLLALFFVVFAALAKDAPSTDALPRLTQVRWDAKDSHTRFVFQFSGEPAYRSRDEQAREGYFYIDFYKVDMAGQSRSSQRLDDKRAVSLRRRVFPDQQVLRFIFDTQGTRDFVIGTLQNPPRVVVDIYDAGRIPTDVRSQPASAGPGSSVPAAAPQAWSGPANASAPEESSPVHYRPVSAVASGGRPFKVIIDPGHGGRSLGAASLNKFGGKPALEKDIALSISKALRDLIDKDPSIECVMTRTDDTYVSLEDRVDFAEARNADLFVSIHLNAGPGNQASGPEFYYLSDRGQEQLQRRVAKSSGAGGRSKKIIERVAGSRVATLNRQSKRFCELVNDSFNKIAYYKSRNRGIKTANFFVLKNATSPAVLIEVAFMTDDADVTRHRQAARQREAARQIYEAIQRFAAESRGD